jgi:hypothetical protein
MDARVPANTRLDVGFLGFLTWMLHEPVGRRDLGTMFSQSHNMGI